MFILIIIVILILIYKKISSFTNEPEIYVINVPGPIGEERRKHIQKVFSQANIKYTFYPGYNKNEINMDRYKKHKHRELTKGEVALSMTHNDLYKKLLESDKEYMLIAEDDCTFRPNFKDYLTKILKNLPEDFDIVKLGYISNSINGKYNMEDNPLVPYHSDAEIKFNKNLNYPGTECYIVSRKGAKFLLEINEPIWLPSDGALDPFHHQVKLNKIGHIYYLEPPIAWQGNVKSIISE